MGYITPHNRYRSFSPFKIVEDKGSKRSSRKSSGCWRFLASRNWLICSSRHTFNSGCLIRGNYFVLSGHVAYIFLHLTVSSGGLEQ